MNNGGSALYGEHLTSNPSVTDNPGVLDAVGPPPATIIRVGLLTGGKDRPYALGLASALLSRGVHLDFIGSDDLDSPELRANPRLNFLNLRGSSQSDVGLGKKLLRVLIYYARLLQYAMGAKATIFHILWNNKFEYFDRTLLIPLYRLLGKKIAFTAHNVNAGKRDSKDSLVNRLTLRMQYRLVDHIFVHTEEMKRELLEEFAVRKRSVSVIPFGINNAVPSTDVTPAEARRRLGVKNHERTLLFFGNIGPYKGLEFLVEAFHSLASRGTDYRLIIAGGLRGGAKSYWNDVEGLIRRDPSRERITTRIEFIPDEDTELYFKAADVLVLPYTFVSQSGVLFLGYSFGLPVIATDVGALKDDIVVGKTGFLCQPRDPADLARAIETYFASDLFENLHARRKEIQDYANSRHSWEKVADTTRDVYANLIAS